MDGGQTKQRRCVAGQRIGAAQTSFSLWSAIDCRELPAHVWQEGSLFGFPDMDTGRDKGPAPSLLQGARLDIQTSSHIPGQNAGSVFLRFPLPSPAFRRVIRFCCCKPDRRFIRGRPQARATLGTAQMVFLCVICKRYFMILPVADKLFLRNLAAKPFAGGMGKNVKKL
jgi:hypothetical protein